MAAVSIFVICLIALIVYFCLKKDDGEKIIIGDSLVTIRSISEYSEEITSEDEIIMVDGDNH